MMKEYKKIFLSLPMKKYTDEEIEKNIETMKKFVGIYMKDEPFIVVDAFTETKRHGIDKIAKDCKHPSVYYLSKAIEMLSDCDMMFKIECTWMYDGCLIEEGIANRYDIPVIEIPKDYFNLHDFAEGIEIDKEIKEIEDDE